VSSPQKNESVKTQFSSSGSEDTSLHLYLRIWMSF